MKTVLFTPNPTGTGHNMRALALAGELIRQDPSLRVVAHIGSNVKTFAPLFENIGAIVTVADDAAVDHAQIEHMSTRLDKANYVDGYLVPTFLNGSRILDYLALFHQFDPDLVISDYNICASIAALIGGRKHVLVTERYDFSVVQLSNSDLRCAGFIVDDAEMDSLRPALQIIFDWIIRGSMIVLTDKPAVAELDSGTALYAHLDDKKVHFLGPLVRRPPEDVNEAELRARLKLGDGPVFVASVGGTTMFLENRDRAVAVYREAFRLLHIDHPDAVMVLLGRGVVSVEQQGVVMLDYLPDWMPLLKIASALVSQPGWITATEVASLKVPTVFILGGRGEYHEIEALERLRLLGFPTIEEPEVEALHKLLAEAVTGDLAARCARPLERLAPTDAPGAPGAAALIREVL